MKVKVLRGFCIGKGNDVSPGDIIELSDREAALKIKQGKVRDASLPEKVKKNSSGNAPLLYPLEEALELIKAAVTIADVDEVIKGDTRKAVLQAANAQKELLEKELEKEAEGGEGNA